MASTQAYIQENLQKWSKLLNNLFGGEIPSSMSWSGPVELVNVLKQVGADADCAYLFYPDHGTRPLTGAVLSPTESGCIELRSGGTPTIVKGRKLSFESVGPDIQWAYFRLESEPLAPTGVYEEFQGAVEEVAELDPGTYAPRSAWDEGRHEGNPLPSTTRIVERDTRGGAYVIFAKGSIYNQVSETWDGRHSRMTSEQFREYIRRSADRSANAQQGG